MQAASKQNIWFHAYLIVHCVGMHSQRLKCTYTSYLIQHVLQFV